MSRSYSVTVFASITLAIILSGTSVSAADQPLKYAVKPEQVVPYQVTIVADTPSETQTMKGVITFRGVSAESDRFTVKYFGGLGKTTKAKGQSSGGRFGGRGPGGPPRGPRGPGAIFGQTAMRGLTQTSNELVVANDGKVLSMTGDSQLPFVLGNLSLMVFEPLGDGTQKSWKTENGITITEKDSSGPPFGPRGFRGSPFGEGDETSTGGSESTTYNVQQDDGKLVTIKRSYQLSSPAPTGKDTGYSLIGDGNIVFNRELSALDSAAYKLDFTIGSGNATVKIPVSVELTRMTDEAYAAHVKEREEMIAKSQARSEESKSGVPYARARRKEILEHLKSDDKTVVMKELQDIWISNKREMHKDDADIVARFGELNTHADIGIRHLAGQLHKRFAVEAVAAKDSDKTMPKDDNPFKTVDPAASLKGMRTWTDATGKFKIEAEFMELKDKTVFLKQKDGKDLEIELSALSKADQELIEKGKK
ncbi:MAG TPA: SHD1 domain-containing protein [Planctomycetaceae bacterium]|nr:SHD1 domain-containing protein [Planctomycetaceae bacterium]